jgi:aminoglycoside/choline kinase family phosphotransferase
MEDILSLCSKSGMIDPEIKKLKGDYSERSIFRVNHDKGSAIAVYGTNIAENEAFLSFRNTFERNGFNVPEFVAFSDDHKTYLIGDLGDITVKSYCDEMLKFGNLEAIKAVYSRILKKLPEIQAGLYDKIDYSKCYQSAVFDSANMESDISRFEEFFLKKHHKNYDPQVFNKFKNGIISSADSQDKNYFFYRDFQTRNIMIKGGELYFIDFQSGRKGSFYYDLASFIYSSGTVNYEGMESSLAGIYYDSAPHIKAGADEFRSVLGVFACLRIMQALGNYAYYYYTRNDRSLLSKKENGLKTIMNLSRHINLQSGIYEG